jgi:hypothetical protein
LSVWQALRERNLIGSDAAIVWACAQHVYFASMFVSTTDANGAIGMTSLLAAAYGVSWLAAMVLLVFAALAVIAEWAPGLSRFQRFLLLFPQFVLLLIPAVGAITFTLMQHYADCIKLSECVFRSWKFISCDQCSLIGIAVWYGTAILARVREL